MNHLRRPLVAAVAVVASVLVLGGPNPRPWRNAMTNEGYQVVMVRPVNGLPPGWTWLP